MPRVSVIVPAHNSGAFIDEALVSIERQTFRDFEVVVVDDASRDDTAERAERHAARVVRSETNIGPAAARNLALTHATGELVALLDADDLWEPEFLSAHVTSYDRAAAAGGRPGIVTGDARILTPAGYQVGTYRDEHPLAAALTLRRLLERNPIFVSSLTPRAVVGEVGGFDEEIWGAEDFDLWLRIVERGYDVLVLDEPLAVYRRHQSALTTSQARAARSHVLAYSRALERGNLTPDEARVARRQLRYSRAVEAVALALEPGPQRQRARRHLVRRLPLIAAVALSHRELWHVWARGARARLARS